VKQTLSRLSFLLVVLLVFQQFVLPVEGVLAEGINSQDSVVTEPIDIPDANLKNALNYLLNRTPEAPIYEADLQGFQKLDLSGKNIESIEGLQYATNLTELGLNWNNIQDISPVANLTNLTKLYLDDNEVSDLAPVQNLTNLDSLGVGGNPFTDIGPLANLTKLTYLNLSRHHLTDVSPLSNLTNLSRLFLDGGPTQTENKLTDIGPLANLINLNEVYLGNNKIKDLSPLSNLPVLSGLYLDYNQIEDISPLANLPLVVLNLRGNQISDIDALRELTNMSMLYLNSNKITDISVLTNMNRLQELDLGENRIRDIAPLKYALPNLRLLDLSSNLLTDISLIENSGYYIKNLNVNYNFIPYRQYQYHVNIPSQYREMEVMGKGPILIPVEITADKQYSYVPDFNREKGMIFTVESKNDHVEATLNDDWNLVVTGLAEGEAEVTLAFPNPDLNQSVHIGQVDLTAPDVPRVDEVTDKSGYATGFSEQYAKISLKIGDWIQVTDTYNEGYFYFNLPAYPAGTKMEFTSTDRAGNVSEPRIIEVKDATGPAFTKIEEVTDQSTSVKGVVEAGATVKVMAEEALLGTTTAGEDGQFEVAIPKQRAGWNVLKVIAVDTAGNETVATLDVRDATPPSKPIVNNVTDQDSVITGKVDAGVTTVNVMKKGVIFAHAVVDAEGNFTATIPVQKSGTEIQIEAVETAGNASEIAIVVVQDVTPPVAPMVNEVTDKDTSVSGISEAGTTIEVKVFDSVIGRETVGSNGMFTVGIPVQTAGTELVITVIDSSENRSESVTRMVKDTTAPLKPEVNEIDEKTTAIRGKAEPGTTVEVRVNGSVIGRGEVKSDGTFSVGIPVQKAGTMVDVFVTDSAGNTSEKVSIQVKEVKKYGWIYENSYWYYYDLQTGQMKTGWLNDRGTWYYLDASGKMKTGWLKDGGVWYYLNGSGAMQTGWLKDGGVWYYLKSSGAMQTGWLKDGGVWYYLKSSGAMQTGWLYYGGAWYYLSGSGAMVTGWKLINNRWYYFNSGGALQ
jgi:Leucine-rich repeat (LRR) protein